MENVVFAVFDLKARAYLPPFCFPTEEMGVRAFANMANESGHQWNANPEDYVLFRLGLFNQETAVFTTPNPPENLGTAIQFIKKAPNGAQVDAFENAGGTD